MRGKLLGFLAAALALGLVVACAPAAAPTPTAAPKAAPEVKPEAPKPAAPTAKPEVKPPAPTFSWKLSTWGPPRVQTFAVDWWAKEMEKRTNGGLKVEIVYGEGLAKSTEMLDGIKAGAFEMAQFAGTYHPGKNPLTTIIDLPFFTPADVEAVGQLEVAVMDHPALKEEMKKWNAFVLLPCPFPQSALMGKKKITKVEDLKGVRIRVSGEAAKLFQEFGAVPSLVPAPELYTALDKGMIDIATFPWTYAFYDYKIHEVSKYATTKIDFGLMYVGTVVNIDAWNKLPPEWQKIALELRGEVIKRYAEDHAKADAKNIDLFKKAGVEILEFPAAERAKLVAVADKYWKAWAEDKDKKGLPGKEVLEFALAKKKELEKK